jgi:hypothetical protein
MNDYRIVPCGTYLQVLNSNDEVVWWGCSYGRLKRIIDSGMLDKVLAESENTKIDAKVVIM